ncbi:MAG: DegV family protein [Dehalococcoidia bacterium]|nr:MAG: DegV family protein [Dehalococcoidia bacterium]
MVKVVTDSCSDITPQLAQELGITVVPLYVQFGNETYRDNVDLSTEGFYNRLEQSKIIPTTSTVTPGHVSELFSELAEETNEILVITVSQLLSGTYSAVLQGKAMVSKDCRIEVIDSQTGIGGQMLLTIKAAQMADSGTDLDQIAGWVRGAVPRVHVRVSFDTLEYLRKGGRIGKAQAFLGTLLKVNPVLAIKDGATFPIARPRNRAQAMDFLVNFVKGFKTIEALAIEDATTPDELEVLAERLKDFVPPDHTYRSKVSPVVGTHVGPHVLAVSVLEAL